MRRKRKSEFYRLRRYLFLDISTAAQWFEVTERTIRNWDQNGAPKLAMRLLQERERRLSSWHPAWSGFRIGRNRETVWPKRFTAFGRASAALAGYRPLHVLEWRIVSTKYKALQQLAFTPES
ncbi:hypothetical protein ACR2R6_06140 [Methylocaldum gracile subsp. desertum]|uniref:hypothetical protein n=1 Tax=Methylocaldum sp. GT1BW TaxID=3438964 RepID=UPI003D9FC69E